MSQLTEGRIAGQGAQRRQFIYRTGLCEGTQIMTPDGNLPVEYLCEGDLVITRTGVRAIRRISAAPLEERPILVQAGALGPGRPERDLCLAPDQCLELAGWQGRQIYGADQRPVPLTRLVDGDYVRWGEVRGDILVYELEFLTQQVFYADGLEVISTASPFRVVPGSAAA